MDENSEVIPAVRGWLRKKFPGHRFRVEQNPPNIGIDLEVTSFSEIPVLAERTTITFHVQVECKGSTGDVDRALGQSLGYHALSNEVPTYLAVPKDYFRIGHLKRVIEALDLPLGLLIVHQNGEIKSFREARGNPQTQLLRKLAGYRAH